MRVLNELPTFLEREAVVFVSGVLPGSPAVSGLAATSKAIWNLVTWLAHLFTQLVGSPRLTVRLGTRKSRSPTSADGHREGTEVQGRGPSEASAPQPLRCVSGSKDLGSQPFKI